MYTPEMFETVDEKHRWRNGRVLTLEETAQRERTVVSHTFVDDTDPQPVMFYSDNHLFGYGRLPKNCVPCTTGLPYKIAPRPGFETGYVSTARDLIRFDQQCNPKRVILQTTQELVDYLNRKGFRPEDHTR